MTNAADTMPASARILLRHETADLHTELDAMLSRFDFNDRSAYADFLARQAAPLFAMETALEHAGVSDVLSDWPKRRRADAIRSDISALGVTMPDPAGIAPIIGIDAMFGALYVLEGSRLGAKFLVRTALASKDADVRAATAYLGHGEGERFWPTFLDGLAQREAQGLDRAKLAAGARDAFAVFIESAKPHRAPA